jgi:hypothetical protein
MLTQGTAYGSRPRFLPDKLPRRPDQLIIRNLIAFKAEQHAASRLTRLLARKHTDTNSEHDLLHYELVNKV